MIVTRADQRMSRPNDARALRSREALRAGLLALLQEQPFHQISIRDITNRAGVSYPVFFRRYASKDELFADLAAEEVRNLLGRSYPMLEDSDPASALHELCAYVQDRRTLWKALLTTGGASAMRDEFARISAELGHSGPRRNPWLPVSLASSFVAAAIFEILTWWLVQPEDYPMRNIELFLEHLILRPTTIPQNVEIV
jgi:AcrR family transcriptional regulator